MVYASLCGVCPLGAVEKVLITAEHAKVCAKDAKAKH